MELDKNKVIASYRQAQEAVDTIKVALIRLDLLDELDIPEYARTIQMNNVIKNEQEKAEKQIQRAETILKNLYK